MLLGEPPRTPWDLNFSLLGIPVRVHPLFWLVAALLGWGAVSSGPSGAAQLTGLVIWVAAVFLSILVHEFGHALTARSFGAQPWVTLYAFGGLASHYTTLRDWRRNVLVTIAGPGAGFLFAAVILAAVAVAGYPAEFSIDDQSGINFFATLPIKGLESFVNYLLWINIFWGIINLMPVYPLDGGQIARELFLRFSSDGIRRSLLLSAIAGAGVAVLALLQLKQPFLALMFGFFAYQSYMMLQGYTGGGFGRWR